MTAKFLVTVTTKGDMDALGLHDMQDILSEVDRHAPHAGPIISLHVEEVRVTPVRASCESGRL